PSHLTRRFDLTLSADFYPLHGLLLEDWELPPQRFLDLGDVVSDIENCGKPDLAQGVDQRCAAQLDHLVLVNSGGCTRNVLYTKLYTLIRPSSQEKDPIIVA